MRSRQLLACALLIAGCDDARAPLDLDAIAEPSDECVRVIHETLELGGPLHRFVSDGPGSAGGWGMITFINEFDLPALALVRVPASASEAPTARIELGMSSPDPELVQLRAGSEPGEVWALSRSGQVVVLRRIVPELGLIATNGMLGNFPIHDDDGGACPSEHSRTLLVIEGQPYLLALPNCSDTPALDLHLLALERETLDFLTSWQLSFDPCAPYDDPAACAEIFAYSLSAIGPGTSTLLPDAARIPVGFTQVRAFTGGLGLSGTVMSSDVSLLDMRMTSNGPSARLVTFREVWIHSLPLALGPVSLGQDPYSTQLHIRNELLEDDAALMRFDTIGEFYVQLRDPELLPLGGRGQLVQLPDQAAMIDVEGGGLHAAPLADIGAWPFWTERTVLELDDLVDFEISGVGQLLLRRDQVAPQLVYLSCLD
ncbi:hypothetical protein ENSA5_13370 [Enhygromyxa salina]|uniref:Lipoprotein n=1 Tax=Enhygromyxa salina TaxID=215803 RepID=A0A2S9YF23_9BACT|nr:hypothetical protein [Enhygromyxa salina]PRQ03715.1 hypothetical protein ENSA5_13370 [Enhygromyxa salina]